MTDTRCSCASKATVPGSCGTWVGGAGGAACRDMGAVLFFPLGERTEGVATQVAEAKGMCVQYGVRIHYLAYALVANS